MKLKEIMGYFQDLREGILLEYKKSLHGGYYNFIGEVPSEELMKRWFLETESRMGIGKKRET